MKNNLFFSAAFSILALNTSSVLAADASTTGHISAKIVSPVTINETQGLDFGTILAPTDNKQTVTISTDGSRASSDDSILVSTNVGQAGLFNVTGADKQHMTINVTSSTTLTGTGDPMTVDNFTTDPASELTLSDSAGQIKVGAQLTVGAKQVEGDYSGTYTVTVNY